MNQTRRGFLGLLAHLPLVGAWFLKPILIGRFLARSESQEVNYEKSELPDELEFDGKFYRHFDREMCRLIRWIPVTERLPDSSESAALSILVWKSDHMEIWGCSGDIPMYAMYGITHWAELPAPPTEPTP